MKEAIELATTPHTKLFEMASLGEGSRAFASTSPASPDPAPMGHATLAPDSSVEAVRAVEAEAERVALRQALIFRLQAESAFLCLSARPATVRMSTIAACPRASCSRQPARVTSSSSISTPFGSEPQYRVNFD